MPMQSTDWRSIGWTAAVISRAMSTLVLVGALLVVVATVVRQAPTPGVIAVVGLVVAAPTMVLGQLRTILEGNRRVRERETEADRAKGFFRRASDGGYSVDDLFGGLSRPLLVAVFGLFFLGVLGGCVLRAPTPETTPGSCEALLSEHGDARCVDAEALDRYQAGNDRLFALVIVAFSAVHAGAAHATLKRMDEEEPAGTPF